MKCNFVKGAAFRVESIKLDDKQNITLVVPCKCSIVFFRHARYRSSKVTPCPAHEGRQNEIARQNIVTGCRKVLKDMNMGHHARSQ